MQTTPRSGEVVTWVEYEPAGTPAMLIRQIAVRVACVGTGAGLATLVPLEFWSTWSAMAAGAIAGWLASVLLMPLLAKFDVVPGRLIPRQAQAAIEEDADGVWLVVRKYGSHYDNHVRLSELVHFLVVQGKGWARLNKWNPVGRFAVMAECSDGGRALFAVNIDQRGAEALRDGLTTAFLTK